MATLKTDKIDKALRKKGFSREERDHHFYFYLYNGKKTAVNTKISHGNDEIGDPLIIRMSRQIHLDKEQFIQLVQCTLNAETYKQVLIDKGIIK